MPLLAIGDDQPGRRIASRVANLALATTQDARFHVLSDDEAWWGTRCSFASAAQSVSRRSRGRPHVRLDEPDVLLARLTTALAIVGGARREVVLELGGTIQGDELMEQRTAVLVLDAICSAFD